tara:strand:- start:143 stop:541 length:399 start_codon:yes stop_codon:yes gene_type:complete
MSDYSKLRDLAKKTSELAHSPYSNAKVGAAIETEDGTLFGGCNVENSSFGGTTCAEQVAIFKAISEGKKRLKRVYVYTDAGWPPCGICRQIMSEFALPEMEVIISNKQGEEKVTSLKELLPLAFTPDEYQKR